MSSVWVTRSVNYILMYFHAILNLPICGSECQNISKLMLITNVTLLPYWLRCIQICKQWTFWIFCELLNTSEQFKDVVCHEPTTEKSVELKRGLLVEIECWRQVHVSHIKQHYCFLNLNFSMKLHSWLQHIMQIFVILLAPCIPLCGSLCEMIALSSVEGFSVLYFCNHNQIARPNPNKTVSKTYLIRGRCAIYGEGGYCTSQSPWQHTTSSRCSMDIMT